MGLDPATMTMIGMLGAGVGGPVLSALFAPDGQELNSFQDVPGLRPTEFLGRTRDVMSELGKVLSDRAAKPVSLPSAYVQTPGAYSGGTLPFPVGVTGEDPAFLDPSMLTRPGADMGDLSKLFDSFKPSPATPGGPQPDPQPGTLSPDGYHGTPDNYPADDRIAVPKRGGAPGGGPSQDVPLPAHAGGASMTPQIPGFPENKPAGGDDMNAMLDELMGAGGGQPHDLTQRPAMHHEALDDAAAPDPAHDFNVDNLFASSADNSGDDFDQGMANIKLLAAALSRGDVDVSSLLGGL